MMRNSFVYQQESIEAQAIQTIPALEVKDAEDEGHIRERLGRFGLGNLFDRGVEARGVERVPESEREDKHSVGLLLLWFSGNLVLGNITVGMLALPIFALTFPHTVAIVLGFGTLGCVTVGFVATLGPRLGMRTMVITRYAFGYWGATLVSILNILTQIGFSVTSVILAGQILHSLNSNFPLALGVVLIGVISVLICFIGYDLLHYYARYAWIPISILFILTYALGARTGYQISPQIPLDEMPSRRLRAAEILKFGGVMFSLCAGWAPNAADFNCRLPATTCASKIFLLTSLGVLLPIMFTVILGALLMTVPAYVEAYDMNGGVAGVLSRVFQPLGYGGYVIQVLLALSIIADNNSAGLSMQALTPSFRRIPRAIFTVLVFIIYTVAGVAGREHFSDILSNFLAVLGYWLAFWVIILVEEHCIFRRNNGILGGYNVLAYDIPELLPVGFAAIVASVCGIAGAVISMAQEWYVGPVAAMLSPLGGGDMGFEFAAAFAGLVYPPLRWLEIRRWGR